MGSGVRAKGAFGGLEISATGYAQFARAFDPRQRLLSPQADQFINTGNGNRYYALGVRVVRTAAGRNVFHFGDWRATTPKETGLFFATWTTAFPWWPPTIAACRKRHALRSTPRFTTPPMKNERAAARGTHVPDARTYLW
jgi:hypothetical protein